MQTPPDWISAWYTFLIVQVAGLIAAGIAVWKWLTKPIRKDNALTNKRLLGLKKAFKRDSFDHRTVTTSIQGIALRNEKRLDLMEHRLDSLQAATRHIQETLDEGIMEIRDRLKGVETELRVRVEHQVRRERQQGEANDKR